MMITLIHAIGVLLGLLNPRCQTRRQAASGAGVVALRVV